MEGVGVVGICVVFKNVCHVVLMFHVGFSLLLLVVSDVSSRWVVGDAGFIEGACLVMWHDSWYGSMLYMV